MENFITKWKSDNRFRTKIKLLLYTLFIIFVGIFAVSSRNNLPTNEYSDNDDSIESIKDDKITIQIPDDYQYSINITINESSYQYTGTKSKEQTTITKIVDNLETNYIYNDNYYRQDEEGNYLLTTKEEVYDIVDYSYLDLNTINQYLSKSTKSTTDNNQYFVYLKDIILGNDSEDYITITKEQNKIEIDYTELFKYFDKKIYKYLIEIEIIE